ncbi:MAG: hypothetical protein DSY55_03470, partial [Clostridia bacterium]
ELGVDIRGIDAKIVQEVVAEIEKETQRIARQRRLQAEITEISHSQPVRIEQERVAAWLRICRDLGVAASPMVSRAGHDAMYLARLGPVSMLFVRNPAGVSHNPTETALDADIIIATTALAAYLARSAAA